MTLRPQPLPPRALVNLTPLEHQSFGFRYAPGGIGRSYGVVCPAPARWWGPGGEPLCI
jgi:hypothetical protein